MWYKQFCIVLWLYRHILVSNFAIESVLHLVIQIPKEKTEKEIQKKENKQPRQAICPIFILPIIGIQMQKLNTNYLLLFRTDVNNKFLNVTIIHYGVKNINPKERIRVTFSYRIPITEEIIRYGVEMHPTYN